MTHFSSSNPTKTSSSKGLPAAHKPPRPSTSVFAKPQLPATKSVFAQFRRMSQDQAAGYQSSHPTFSSAIDLTKPTADVANDKTVHYNSVLHPAGVTPYPVQDQRRPRSRALPQNGRQDLCASTVSSIIVLDTAMPSLKAPISTASSHHIPTRCSKVGSDRNMINFTLGKDDGSTSQPTIGNRIYR